MSLESELVALVAPLVSGGFWPDAADNGTPPPYAVYHQIGGESPTFIGAEVQIMLAVESVLTLATTLQAKPVGAMRGTLDDESDLRGASQDFTIWADR